MESRIACKNHRQGLRYHRRVGARVLVLVSLILFIGAGDRRNSQMHHHGGEAHGAVSFPISCGERSQAAFNEAMTLLHHMTYPEAREKFREIAKSDPGCAMAYWGIAMTLFQPLWPTRPGPRELRQGWDAVQEAKSLGPPTARERLLIDAVEAFFRDPKSTDYWARITGWKEGMEKAYTAFPKDNEIAALYALALLAVVPPDQPSSPNNAQAADILLRILKENPDHPGAMHYLIHANDAPGREHESQEILRKYAAEAPDNPHALHMPTHIYTRLGEWQEVIKGNLKAADAALKFPAGDRGQFVWDEFPHAIEYLIYAYLQIGADCEAALQLQRLQHTAKLEPTFKTAFHLSSTRARYALERKAWTEAALIEPREPGTVVWDHYPWAEAIGWFAHGLGSLHTGNSSETQRSLQRLVELEAAADKAHEKLFTRNIRILRLGLTAWIMDSENKPDSSVALMSQAAELEAATPKHAVTPGPTLPAYEMLGDLLFAHGKSQEALKAYRRSLELNPKRFNSLLGAARAARTAGDAESARLFYRKLLDMSDPRSQREGTKEGRNFLTTGSTTGGSH